VLFSDDFETDTSANWTIRFGANNGIYDATSTFMLDYSTRGIPPAPHSIGGTTHGVYLDVNKTNSTTGGSAGINLYPNGKSFRGNYALRCDMFLAYGTASTTEHALLGLNHSGLVTNRVTQSTDANQSTRGGDGIWTAIETDGSANREYGAYTFTNATSLPFFITNRSAGSLASLITSPPYGAAGSPGNSPSTKTWAQVELSQINNVVTLKVNNIVIWQINNTFGFTNGNIMLGHNDQFDSIGSAANSVIFDNVQVVSLDLTISSISLLPENKVQIDFFSPLGGVASDFRLQSATDLSLGDWSNDDQATITATENGLRAVTTQTPGNRFYRIRR
jgi:hypothetical protein